MAESCVVSMMQRARRGHRRNERRYVGSDKRNFAWALGMQLFVGVWGCSWSLTVNDNDAMATNSCR